MSLVRVHCLRTKGIKMFYLPPCGPLTSPWDPPNRAKLGGFFNVGVPSGRFLLVKIDGFAKSPSAVRHAHGPERSRRATLRCILRNCSVLLCTPHSSGICAPCIWIFFLCRLIYDFLRDHQGLMPKWRTPVSFTSGKAEMLWEKVIIEGAHHSISMAIFLGLILLNLGMAMNNIPSLNVACTFC